MRVLGIDPGPERTAFVGYETDTKEVIDHGIWPNDDLLAEIGFKATGYEAVALEQIRSYGMPAPNTVHDTSFVSGRFFQQIEYLASITTTRRPRALMLIPRKQVVVHLCGSARAKDANVRQRLIDLHGGKQKALGNKAEPGPLYGIKADEWAALAVAITGADLWRAERKIEEATHADATN